MKKTMFRFLLQVAFTLSYLCTVAQNVGIGTGSPNYNLHINDTSILARLQFTSGFTGTASTDGFIVGHSSETGQGMIWNKENQDILFATTDLVRMQIKADGKVGIGTGAPNYDVQIHNGFNPARLQFTTFFTGAASTDGFIVGHNSETGQGMIWNRENEDILFLTNDMTRMNIKADGKVGIGTGSPNEDVHIHNSVNPTRLQFTSAFTGTASTDGFSVGTYDEYGKAMIWNRENDDILVATNNIPWIWFKAGGKIGIGTGSPNEDVHIHNSVNPTRLQFTSAFTGTASTDGFSVGTYDEFGQAMIWNRENEDILVATNNIPRMRIKADGKVGIGTASPTATLHILSATNTTALSITDQAAGSLTLGSYYNETAPSAIRGKSTATGNNDGAGVFGSAITSSPGYGIGGVFAGKWYGLVGAGQPGGSAGVFADASGASNAIFINGNIAGTGTNNYASDARLKKNILPLKNALGAILKLNPVVYEFKVGEFGSMSLPPGSHFGLIAQDVQQIYPQLVIENTFDGDSKEGLKYLGVNYNELIAVLIKGVQEINMELRNEVAALKSENDALVHRIEKLESLFALKD